MHRHNKAPGCNLLISVVVCGAAVGRAINLKTLAEIVPSAPLKPLQTVAKPDLFHNLEC